MIDYVSSGCSCMHLEDTCSTDIQKKLYNYILPKLSEKLFKWSKCLFYMYEKHLAMWEMIFERRQTKD